MNTLILTRGIQGSGKSTWAKAWVGEDPARRCRVSLDDIRKMAGPYWVDSREHLISTLGNNAVMICLKHHRDVVLDCMNLDKKGIRKLVKFLNKNGLAYGTDYKIEFKDFKLSLEDCLKRNATRKGDDYIKEDVIISTYNKYRYFYEDEPDAQSISAILELNTNIK